MAGVRLATGYIEISAETSKVPKQIQDALNQAGTQAAKPAGAQMGKDIAQGIQDGLKTAPQASGGTPSILNDIVQGKPIGGNVREQAKKVGKEVATGINQGIQQGDTGGKKLDDVIIAQTKPKETGKKIGKQVNEGVNEGISDAGKGPIDIIKEGVKDFGKQIRDEVKSGDVKGAFGDVGDVVANTTSALKNMGDVIGIHLDGVERFGTDAANTLDRVGGDIQGVVDKIKGGTTNVKGIADNVKSIATGDTPAKIKGVSDALGGIATAVKDLTGKDISGFTRPIQDLAGTAGEIAQLAASLKEIRTTVTQPLPPTALPTPGGKPAGPGEVPPVAGPGVLGQVGLGLVTIPLVQGAVRGLGPSLYDWLESAPSYAEKNARLQWAMDHQAEASAKDFKPPWTGTKPVPAAPIPAIPGGTIAGGGEGGTPYVPGLTAPSGTPVAPPPAVVKTPAGVPIPTAELPGGAPPRPPPTTAVITPSTVSTQSMSVSAGSVSVSGGSINVPTSYATPATAPASPYRPGFKSWYQTGGDISGSGAVPIVAHGGEHVLTAADVAAMGGQDAVYAMRNALHYQNGGAVLPIIPDPAGGTAAPHNRRGLPGSLPPDYGRDAMTPWKVDDKGRIIDSTGKYVYDYVKRSWTPLQTKAGIGGAPPPLNLGAAPGGGGQFNPDIKLDPSTTSIQGPYTGPLTAYVGTFKEGGEVEGGTPQWLKDQAAKAGMSPEQYLAVMAHMPPGGQPGLPGPGGGNVADQQAQMQQGIFDASGGQAADDLASGRTGGFVPSGAGSKAVSGTSFVAGLLNIGNEAVAGLIDTGASAAQMAASAAAAAGTFGAGGQAGGAAAGIGIQIAAGEAKRAASYGFQMASILADAGIEQLFGMFGGPPRWLGYDYSQFVPNVNWGQIGTTTVEKAMQQQQGKGGGPGQQPGGPVTPEHLPGEQPVGAPVPKFGQPAAPMTLGGAGPSGAPAAPGAPSGPQDMQAGLQAGLAAGGVGAPPPAPPPPAAPGAGGVNGSSGGPIQDIFSSLIGDEGGVLNDKGFVANTSGRPELLLSPEQMDALSPILGGRNPYSRGGDTYHITAVDANDVAKEIDKRKKLAMMQYSGRP